MKKNVLSMILAIIIILCSILTACTDSGAYNDSDRLTVYAVNENDMLVRFLKKFNAYCNVNDREDDCVEFVYFDSYEEYEAKLNAEIMAGKGPDVLALSQNLPIEKLINNNNLLDLNEVIYSQNPEFNFDNYNKVVMDSGVFNGKRYILPLYYCPDFLVTSNSRLEHLGVELDGTTFLSLCDDINQDEPDCYLVHPDFGDNFFYSFVNQYIDIRKGTTEFETDEFKNLAPIFRKALVGDSYDDFSSYDAFSETNREYLLDSFENGFNAGSFGAFARSYLRSSNYIIEDSIEKATDNEKLFYPNFNREEKLSATVEFGLMFSSNCKKYDKVMKLVEYMLSFDSQSYYCGGREGDPESTSGGGWLPVNLEVYDASYKNALEYRIDEYYNESGKVTLSDEVIEKKNQALSEYYRPLLEDITTCSLYDFESITNTYISKNVLKSPINSYLKGDITLDTFISRLTSSVNTYLSE